MPRTAGSLKVLKIFWVVEAISVKEYTSLLVFLSVFYVGLSRTYKKLVKGHGKARLGYDLKILNFLEYSYPVIA